MTTVFNLATGEQRSFVCEPELAVIAAHAQDHHDYNTWEYQHRYSPELVRGLHSLGCGNWACLLQHPQVEES